ncbi:MAG: hypothetical protein ACI9FB_002183 [Candidatus Azotimanducaceae bacterium]|jgi:hypothetical protein
MDNLHRQYLDVMGIDIYSVRTLIDTTEAVGTAEEIGNLELGSLTQGSTSVEASSQVETLSPVATLRERLKAQLGEEEGDSVALFEDAKKKEIPITLDDTAKKEKVDDPQFFFCFLDYDDISLMLSLPVNANSLPAEYRQLCDDIVFALIKKRKIPKVRELRWPMVSAAHIKQGEDDARLIIGEMISQCHDSLILFGDLTANYRSEKKQGTYLLVEDIAHYLSNHQAKPELWVKLSPLFLVR